MEEYEQNQNLEARRIDAAMQVIDQMSVEQVDAKLAELEQTFERMKAAHQEQIKKWQRLRKSMFGAARAKPKPKGPPRAGSVNRKVYDVLVKLGPTTPADVAKRIKHPEEKLVHVMRLGSGRYWTRDGNVFTAIEL